MAASDVLAQFMPNLAATKSYLPDSELQARLIQNITDAQQQRIKQMGDLQAQAAGAPYAGLVNLLKSGEEGYKFATEESAQQAKTRVAQAQAAAQELETEHRAKAYGAEDDFLDSEDPKGPMDPDSDPSDPTHLTHRQEALQSGLDVQALAPQEHSQKLLTDLAESNARVEASHAGVKNSLLSTMDAHTQTLMAEWDMQVKGIATKTPPNSPERAQQMTAAAQAFARKNNIDVGTLNNWASLSATQQDATAAGNKATAELGFKLSPEGVNMGNVTSKGVAQAQMMQTLKDAAQQYKSNLYVNNGVADFVGANQKALAVQARDNFANTLDGLGQGDLANNIRGWDIKSVGARMDQIMSTMAPQIKANWGIAKQNLLPTTQQRPEITQVDAIMNGLDSGTPGSSQIFKPTPAKAPNTAFTNPPKPGGAQAAPAQAPAIAPAAPPPGMPAPPPQAPQFSPDLLEPNEEQQ